MTLESIFYAYMKSISNGLQIFSIMYCYLLTLVEVDIRKIFIPYQRVEYFQYVNSFRNITVKDVKID